MTPTEAYHFAMEKVNELKDWGIEVTVTSWDASIKRMIKSSYKQKPYDPVERIPPKLWTKVNFKFTTNIQADGIMEAANYLGICGITFDTGGSANSRDWQLDFSFRYREGYEDNEWREARESLENELRADDAY